MQDILRWLVIAALLVGAFAKFAGILMRVLTAVIAIAAGFNIRWLLPALADVQTLLLNWAIILALAHWLGIQFDRGPHG